MSGGGKPHQCLASSVWPCHDDLLRQLAELQAKMLEIADRVTQKARSVSSETLTTQTERHAMGGALAVAEEIRRALESSRP